MKRLKPELAVIGAGPAGLAATIAASKAGLKDIVLIDRDFELGGILQQCIHDGFGSIEFKEVLAGPQYAQRFIDQLHECDVDVMLNTMVLDLSPEKVITAVNPTDGMVEVQPKALVLAMGCRERSRHQVLIPGYRPAGVITAGAAQRDINIEGIMPGRKLVILGSGDIGLIMARRFTLEGATVEGVYEIMDHPGGLTRNVVQCLDDFGIPLHLSHTVSFVHGKKRVEGVNVAAVDENLRYIKETERYVPCDTLCLSVGLIPENELSKHAGVELDPVTAGPVVDERMETNVEGIFACGNVVNVFDLVDYVTRSARAAGEGAAEYVKGGRKRENVLRVVRGRNVKYVVPQVVSDPSRDVDFYFRVEHPERAVRAIVTVGSQPVSSKKHKMVRPPEMLASSARGVEMTERGAPDEIKVEVVSDEREA
jgi:NADPH-dependent 2,4-dienoyl-CoA reductase/sulfur reductase-like enzyme